MSWLAEDASWHDKRINPSEKDIKKLQITGENPTHEGTGTRRPSWKNVTRIMAESSAKNNLVVGFLKSICGPIMVT